MAIFERTLVTPSRYDDFFTMEMKKGIILKREQKGGFEILPFGKGGGG